MAIRFNCSSCSQPIEIDDEWSSRTVACPYCRKTITAPAESTLTDLSQIPTASPVVPNGVQVLESPVEQPGVSVAVQTNPVAKAALILACCSLVLIVIYLQVAHAHRLELMELTDPNHTTAEQMQAFAAYADAHGGQLPSWMVGMFVSFFGGGLSWVATIICGIIGMRRPQRRNMAVVALAMAGLVPMLTCCGGVLTGP